MDKQWCRVYWGSHGCELERGHEGPHLCSGECVCDGKCERTPEQPYCPHVGMPPYYGPGTLFYGEDATPETVGQWGTVINDG